PQIAAAVALRERLFSPAPGSRLAASRNIAPRHLYQEQDTVRALYSQRGFAPLWVRSGHPTRAADAGLHLVCNADDYGLAAEDYGCTALTSELRFLQGYGSVTAADASSAQDWTDFEVGMSAALSAFLSDVHGGRIDP